MGIRISLRRPYYSRPTAPSPHPKNSTTQQPTNEQPPIGDTIPSLTSSILPNTGLSSTTELRHPRPTTVDIVPQGLDISPTITRIPASLHLPSGTPVKPLLTKTTHPEPEPCRFRPLTLEDPNLLPTPPKNLATRHEYLGNKKENWSLTPSREVLVIGDSNISRLPPINDTRIQVDGYPGANLIQAIHLIKYKTPTSTDTKKVLLGFGLNDRNKNNTSILNNNLNQLLSSARDTFPNATIHIPSINFSVKLPLRAVRNIANLNKIVEQIPGHVTKLGGSDFTTGDDLIHWTPNTAKKMRDHWRSSLGLRHENI
ncbi:Fructose-16-bisphosphatase class 1 1 [Dissostichus eleginoides]|uniref:Fructose-16-bisphosphatase class 1 1 n=1 Tax=Dissostichus eleginoides TaxID=100907 RepID=A0AAD9CGC3_DISEL|nr:Fructose-16-bisphosphatase class 1 1 [Dissostichus eleginoides]